MRCCIVEDSDDRYVTSTSYCFCTKCGAFIANSHFKYCPWCRHKFDNHPVHRISRDVFDKIIELKERRDVDDYINTLPDPQTLREKILSWFSDTSDRVKIWANTKFSDNYINNTLLKGHHHES